MNCPKCQTSDTKVVDSRAIGNCIRRRRMCIACSYRFTTYERPEPVDRRVQKRDGSTEPFDRNKISKSIEKACNKRPVLSKEIESISYEIEHELFCKYDEYIPSKAIGKIILEKLIVLDEVSYLRFASVYKNFKSAKTFSREIDKIASKD